MYIIETQNLTKSYAGFTVVSGINLHIPKGTVYGFLGPNGAGKSTTMKMFLGLTKPTGGSFVIDGRKYPKERVEILKEVVSGACIMYHTEYADNAIQRMCTLPTKKSTMFFGKAAVLIAVSILLLVLEAVSIFSCSVYWFPRSEDLSMELIKNFGFFFLMMLPAVLLSLLTSSLCKNMWISFGIGVICVFLATMIPTRNFVLTLFPFALPFQVFSSHTVDVICDYAAAGVVEIAVTALLEIMVLKLRRSFA